MTPQQMLAKVNKQPAPPVQISNLPSVVVDHTMKLLAPLSPPGERIKRSTGEPWVLEQFGNSCCPICNEHLFHMVSTVAPDIHYYVCEDQPVDHRWTLVED